MKTLASIAERIAFFLGDMVSKVMDATDSGFLYPLYNKLMGISYNLSEKYDLGVWK